MLQALVVLLLAAIGIVLVLALRRPEQFRTARSMKINASPARLHSLIDNLRAMNTWNPYALRETGGSSSYSGPESGPGATFTFDGPKSGTGSIRVLETSPSNVVMQLLMTKPFAADNRVEFSIEPQGTATEVTWAMSGRQPLLARIVTLFIDCESMVGRDFDEGLANLKAIAEKP